MSEENSPDSEPCHPDSQDDQPPPAPSLAQAFLIRCQGRGILTNRVYLFPPTEMMMRKELETTLLLHGHDRSGTAKERFVSYVPCEIAANSPLPWHEYPATPPRVTGKLTPEESAAVLKGKPAPAPSGVAVAAQKAIQTTGTGTVTNPGDPGYAEAVAAAKKTGP